MAHFLIDASLPRAVGERIRSYGHQATDVRDIGLGAAEDHVVAQHAQQNRFCLLTADRGFGNLLRYPPQDYSGIAVLRLPEAVSRSVVLGMIEGILRQPPLIEQLVGHLAVVAPGRVRLRPGFSAGDA